VLLKCYVSVNCVYLLMQQSLAGAWKCVLFLSTQNLSNISGINTWFLLDIILCNVYIMPTKSMQWNLWIAARVQNEIRTPHLVPNCAQVSAPRIAPWNFHLNFLVLRIHKVLLNWIELNWWHLCTFSTEFTVYLFSCSQSLLPLGAH
jgi:hypothetical protein